MSSLARGRSSLGAADRLRIRLVGVLQKAGLHGGHADGRWVQTGAAPGYGDGPSPRTKCVGGHDHDDPYFPLTRRGAPGHAGERVSVPGSSIEEGDGDAAFLTKGLGDIAYAEERLQAAFG